jgi:hypothetical protein
VVFVGIQFILRLNSIANGDHITFVYSSYEHQYLVGSETVDQMIEELEEVVTGVEQ